MLIDQVEPPNTVTKHLEPEFSSLSLEAEKKLVADCLKKVKAAHLRGQALKLKNSFKGRAASEQMEALKQLMEIQNKKQKLFKAKTKTEN